jgi:hypothetical protein
MYQILKRLKRYLQSIKSLTEIRKKRNWFFNKRIKNRLAKNKVSEEKKLKNLK